MLDQVLTTRQKSIINSHDTTLLPKGIVIQVSQLDYDLVYLAYIMR